MSQMLNSPEGREHQAWRQAGQVGDVQLPTSTQLWQGNWNIPDPGGWGRGSASSGSFQVILKGLGVKLSPLPSPSSPVLFLPPALPGPSGLEFSVPSFHRD